VRAIIKSKTNRLIQSSDSLTADTSNTSHLQALTEEVDFSPIPLNELCPVCFAAGAETAFICCDGNFQLTTLGTRLEKRKGVSTQDLKDKRIFVEKIITVCTETTRLILA
jgi:hypothetical protein